MFRKICLKRDEKKLSNKIRISIYANIYKYVALLLLSFDLAYLHYCVQACSSRRNNELCDILKWFRINFGVRWNTNQVYHRVCIGCQFYESSYSELINAAKSSTYLLHKIIVFVADHAFVFALWKLWAKTVTPWKILLRNGNVIKGRGNEILRLNICNLTVVVMFFRTDIWSIA